MTDIEQARRNLQWWFDANLTKHIPEGAVLHHVRSMKFMVSEEMPEGTVCAGDGCTEEATHTVSPGDGVIVHVCDEHFTRLVVSTMANRRRCPPNIIRDLHTLAAAHRAAFHSR